jgi:hypothetical protein
MTAIHWQSVRSNCWVCELYDRHGNWVSAGMAPTREMAETRAMNGALRQAVKHRGDQ